MRDLTKPLSDADMKVLEPIIQAVRNLMALENAAGSGLQRERGGRWHDLQIMGERRQSIPLAEQGL